VAAAPSAAFLARVVDRQGVVRSFAAPAQFPEREVDLSPDKD
tara:strand:+ start:1016 stop:1141 length:126 start_codon:yes stop_codon:yes gene_type:complete